MDAELKTKWIAALRSGKYRQGTGQLFKNSTDEHCCLGVLCRAAGTAVTYQAVHQSGVPYETQRRLEDLNDTDKRNFQQIADYIEANL